MLGEQVDDLALAFVAPLGADHDGRRHWFSSLRLRMDRAASTPDALAWTRPRVTPAPSPIAYRFATSRLQALVELGPRRVELDLDAVEQCIAGRSRRAPASSSASSISRMSRRCRYGQHEGQVARGGAAERGLRRSLRRMPLGGGAVAREQVAQALHDDVVAEQVGQARDRLAVGDGVVEGLGEVGATRAARSWCSRSCGRRSCGR